MCDELHHICEVKNYSKQKSSDYRPVTLNLKFQSQITLTILELNIHQSAT